MKISILVPKGLIVYILWLMPEVSEGETLLDEFIAIVIASGLTSDEEFEYVQKLKNLGFKTKSTDNTMEKSKWRTILKKWTKSENNVKQLVRKFERSIIKRTEY